MLIDEPTIRSGVFAVCNVRTDRFVSNDLHERLGQNRTARKSRCAFRFSSLAASGPRVEHDAANQHAVSASIRPSYCCEASIFWGSGSWNTTVVPIF